MMLEVGRGTSICISFYPLVIYTMAPMGVLSDYNLYRVLSSIESMIEPRYGTLLQIRNALVTLAHRQGTRVELSQYRYIPLGN